jgi:CBS domain-containing protein
MKVKDLLGKKKQEMALIGPKKTVREAIKELMKNKVGSLLVCNESGELVGIITERDIFRLAAEHDGKIMELIIADHMSTNLIIGVPDDEVDYIAHIITENRIRHIPIMDGEKLHGILSIGDIVKARLTEAETTARYLKQYITGRTDTNI